jgi:hypothetical protein
MRQSVFQNAQHGFLSNAHQNVFVFRRSNATPFCLHRFGRQRTARRCSGRIIAPAANAIITEAKTLLIAFPFSLAAFERLNVFGISERCCGCDVLFDSYFLSISAMALRIW